MIELVLSLKKETMELRSASELGFHEDSGESSGLEFNCSSTVLIFANSSFKFTEWSFVMKGCRSNSSAEGRLLGSLKD